MSENVKNKKIELNERDYDIFNLLNIYGCIKKRRLVEIFSEKNTDYKNSSVARRLRKLCKFNYLKSIGISYMLTKLGREVLEDDGVEVLYLNEIRDRNALSLYKASEVMLKLKFKYKQSRIQFIRSEEESGRSVQNIKSFSGIVWNETNEKFIVYKIDKKFTTSNISRMKIDLKSSKLQNIILVVDSFLQVKKFKNEIADINLNKFLVIIDNEKGYELLDLYMKENLNDENLIEYISLVSDKSNPRINQNMLETFNTPTINLMLLDIKKEVQNSSLATLRRFPELNFIYEKSYSEYFEEDEKINHIFKGQKTNISIDISKYKSLLKID